jgi:hypothetical protein
MNRTDAFARDFCRRMEEKSSGRYKWTPCGKPLGKGHESIDVLGTPQTEGRKLVFVEVELRKDAPLTNVVKVWRWVKNERFNKRFVFVQAFSKYYKKGDTKRSNAEFVGKQLERATRNRYLSIPFEYNPYRHGKQGAGRRCHHAYLLADKTRQKLKSIDLIA